MCPLVLTLNLHEDQDLTFFIFKLSFNSHFVFRSRTGGKLNFILFLSSFAFALNSKIILNDLELPIKNHVFLKGKKGWG